MAEAAVAEVSKSQAIRDYLKRNKKAMPTAIAAALKEQGIEVNVQLVSNVKNRLSKGKERVRPWKAKKSSNDEATPKIGRPKKAKLERGEKSQAIRDALTVQGLTARPKDIIAALAARGIEVTSGQVVTVRKSMGGKGRKRRKSKLGRPAASVAPNLATLSIDHLIAAKKLTEQVGGIETARKALEALSKLA